MTANSKKCILFCAILELKIKDVSSDFIKLEISKLM